MTKVTALTLKEAREKALAELPERLKRLNRELAVERSKDFDYIFAVRGEHRFKVAVFRNGGTGFVATCKIGGQVHRYNGDLPSYAFVKLTRSLEWVASRLDYERNMAMREVAGVERQLAH